jgi:hypothetical protein
MTRGRIVSRNGKVIAGSAVERPYVVIVFDHSHTLPVRQADGSPGQRMVSRTAVRAQGRMQTTTLCRRAVVTVAITSAVVTAAAVIWAQEKQLSAVPCPRDFRSWHHVKSIVIGPDHRSFATRGGIHHCYANDVAMERYRTGTFTNGSIVVDEAVFTKDGEGQAKGITLEGDRRGLDVMVKNDRLYKETGGWGFEHFDRDNTTATLSTTARTTCFECHSKAPRDQIFSSVRK